MADGRPLLEMVLIIGLPYRFGVDAYSLASELGGHWADVAPPRVPRGTPNHRQEVVNMPCIEENDGEAPRGTFKPPVVSHACTHLGEREMAV